MPKNAMGYIPKLFEQLLMNLGIPDKDAEELKKLPVPQKWKMIEE